MAEGITLEGKEEIMRRLEYIAQNKLMVVASKAIETICAAGEKEAKKLCPVDTGALRESVEGGVTEVKPGESVTGQVGAGTEETARGEGRFEFSIKQQRNVTRQPTKEYAEKVEERTRFMTSTYNYLKDLAPKQIAHLLKQALQRV